MLDASTFLFDAGELIIDAKNDFIAEIPAGLAGRMSLFETLSRKLQFPSYFGNNWDALSECLRDLSWIEQRRVVLLHQDLPPLNTKELMTYLEVLADSVEDWKPDEDHELIVVFPAEAYSAITDVIQMNL